MDHAIASLLAESAQNLLSPSKQFEPYIPSSLTNAIPALQFLESLGQVAQNSFTQKVSPPPSKFSATAQASPKKPSSLTEKSVLERNLLEALIRAQNTREASGRTKHSRAVIRPSAQTPASSPSFSSNLQAQETNDT